MKKKIMNSESGSTRRQAGFSLVELMIAMVITLVISGAIYGLIASGQTAFKRDPEIADRQQNIRVAMDLMQKDIANAGVGLNPFFQTFGTGLDGVGAVPAAGGGGNTDHLLIFANSGECPDVPVKIGQCTEPNPPGNCALKDGSTIALQWTAPNCYVDNQWVAVIFGNQTAKFGFVPTLRTGGGLNIFFPGSNVGALPQIDLNARGDDLSNPQYPTVMTNLQMIRYEVAVDPSDGLPGLWRSATGGNTAGPGTYVAAPAPAGNWQLVARGIDDFQVGYRTLDGGAAYSGGAPAVSAFPATNYGSIIEQVRVTLSSRTATVRAGKDAQNVMALRGQLTSVTAPRAALNYRAGAVLAGGQQWQ